MADALSETRASRARRRAKQKGRGKGKAKGRSRAAVAVEKFQEQVSKAKRDGVTPLARGYRALRHGRR